MKRLIRAALALLIAVCAVGALTACGGDYAGQKDLENVQTAVEELNRSLAQLKSEIDALKGAGDSGLAGRVQQLETKLTAAQEAVKEIQTSLGTLNTGVDDLDAALTTVNEALAAMREQLDALSGKTENDGSKVKAIGEPTNVYSNGLLIFTITPTKIEAAQATPNNTCVYFTINAAIGFQGLLLSAYIYNPVTNDFVNALDHYPNLFYFTGITVNEIRSCQLYITVGSIPVALYNLSLTNIA